MAVSGTKVVPSPAILSPIKSVSIKFFELPKHMKIVWRQIRTLDWMVEDFSVEFTVFSLRTGDYVA